MKKVKVVGNDRWQMCVIVTGLLVSYGAATMVTAEFGGKEGIQ
jgi:hypothetical protein